MNLILLNKEILLKGILSKYLYHSLSHAHSPLLISTLLIRQFNAKKKNKESKFVLEGMKEDYEARLDRLQCPKCLKYQSFDEWYEKRRICGPCQQRFVKLNVSKFTSWESKQQEHERKKREKLLKISHETYENCSFKPQVNHM